jgi:chemotaxis protein MotA
MADKNKKPPSIFFTTVSRATTLAISRAAAGAGVLGLLGFAGLFIVATVFFITENYFLAMLVLSFALLVYVTGAEVAKLLLSSVTIFFSSKHLISRAAFLQETLVPLRRFLQIRRDSSDGETFGPLEPSPTIKLADNPLSRDLLYDYSSAHLEFVASAMPLFGLIGTIVGLIGMFDTLGADVTVEYLSPQLALALKTTLYGAVFSSIYKIIASRFDQRLKALDYDFETFCRALQVLVDSKVEIEVRS